MQKSEQVFSYFKLLLTIVQHVSTWKITSERSSQINFWVVLEVLKSLYNLYVGNIII
jgi:hypothetical protein